MMRHLYGITVLGTLLVLAIPGAAESGPVARCAATPGSDFGDSAMPGDAGRAIRVQSQGAPGEIARAPACRVRLDDQSIAVGGDRNGNDPGFAVFSAGAPILVLHVAVPHEISCAGRRLHTPPRALVEKAPVTGAPNIVLSHPGARSLRDLDGNIDLVRTGFRGTVHVAADPDCITLNDMAPS